MFELLVRKRRIMAVSSIETAMMFFSVYIIFSMIVAGTITNKGRGLALGTFLSAYGIPFFTFFISKNIIDDKHRIKKLFIFLSVIGLYLGLTGIFEYFQLRQFIFPDIIMHAHQGVGIGRARGPFLNPAANGSVIGMIIFPTFLLFLKESKKWKKWFYIISLACLNAAPIFTLTRSAWVGFLVAILIVPIFMPRMRKAFLISLVVLSIASLLLINFAGTKRKTFTNEGELYIKGNASLIDKIVSRTTTQSTVTARIDLYKMGFVMFLDRPFVGHGYNAFQQSREAYGANMLLLANEKFTQVARIHDTLVALLIDIGLFGVSIYLFIIFNILNVCRKLYNKLPRYGFLGKDLVVICTGTFIVYLISSEMYDIRFYYFPNSLFYCLAGIMAGLYQRNLQSENKNPQQPGSVSMQSIAVFQETQT
jgi:O-antigen ligase